MNRKTASSDKGPALIEPHLCTGDSRNFREGAADALHATIAVHAVNLELQELSISINDGEVGRAVLGRFVTIGSGKGGSGWRARDQGA